MLSGKFAVHINSRMEINGAENDESLAAQLFLCNGYFPFVPDCVDKILIAYSGKFAFGAERYRYFLAEINVGFVKFSVKTGVAEIEFKIPLAVEIYVVFSVKIRVRMLVSGYHRYSPYFFKYINSTAISAGDTPLMRDA